MPATLLMRHGKPFHMEGKASELLCNLSEDGGSRSCGYQLRFSKYKQLLVKLSLLPRTSTEITHLDSDSENVIKSYPSYIFIYFNL